MLQYLTNPNVCGEGAQLQCTNLNQESRQTFQHVKKCKMSHRI